jgi:hypothetical protein
MRGTTCLLVFVAALIVIAAGCGGGGSHRLSHNEFIKKANAICADINKRTVALGYASTRSAAVDPIAMSVLLLSSPSAIANLISWSEKRLPIARQDIGKFKRPLAAGLAWRSAS